MLSGPANASSQSTFSIFFQNVRANWWGDTRGFLRGVGNAGIGLAQTAGSFLSNPVGFTNQTVAGFSGALGSFSGDPRGFTNNIMEAAYASATTSEGIGGITFGALTAIAGGGLLKEIGTVGRVTSLTEKVDLPDAPSSLTAKGGAYKLVDRDGIVKRTGRSKDLDQRKSQHAKGEETKDLDFQEDIRSDDYDVQRGAEHRLYEAHPEARAENGGLNRSKAIRNNNPKKQQYIDADKAARGD